MDDLKSQIYESVRQQCACVTNAIMTMHQLEIELTNEIFKMTEEIRRLGAEKEKYRLANLDLQQKCGEYFERIERLENYKGGFWLVLIIAGVLLLKAIAS
jgi:hypothetical protein